MLFYEILLVKEGADLFSVRSTGIALHAKVGHLLQLQQVCRVCAPSVVWEVSSEPKHNETRVSLRVENLTCDRAAGEVKEHLVCVCAVTTPPVKPNHAAEKWGNRLLNIKTAGFNRHWLVFSLVAESLLPRISLLSQKSVCQVSHISPYSVHEEASLVIFISPNEGFVTWRKL